VGSNPKPPFQWLHFVENICTTENFVFMRNSLQILTCNEDKKKTLENYSRICFFFVLQVICKFGTIFHTPRHKMGGGFHSSLQEICHKGTISPLHANERPHFPQFCVGNKGRSGAFTLFLENCIFCSTWKCLEIVHCEKKAICGALCLTCCSADCVLTSRNFLRNNSDRAKWSPVLR